MTETGLSHAMIMLVIKYQNYFRSIYLHLKETMCNFPLCVTTKILTAHEDSIRHGLFPPQVFLASILVLSQFPARPQTISPPHRLQVLGLPQHPLLPPLPLLLRDWTILPCYAICCLPIHMSCRCWRNVTHPWLRPCWVVTLVSPDDYREQMTALGIVVSGECCLLCDGLWDFHFVSLRTLHESSARAAAGSSQKRAGKNQTSHFWPLWPGGSSQNWGGHQVHRGVWVNSISRA